MGLPRAFVGFSSSDIRSYHLMKAWKANTRFDFNFSDCQLHTAINSTNEAYIKRLCRERISMAGTFISLIGKDTRFKKTYVELEIEVALEKNCRIIAVNLDRNHHDGRRINNLLTPEPLKNVGAIFIPFSPDIIAFALEDHTRKPNDNYHYLSHVYERLGYTKILGLE